jgi:xanthine/uracil permease
MAKFILRIIPVPVLFGIFLYFGIVSLSGTQLYERVKYMFTPFKYCPNLPHAIGVRIRKK